MSVAVPFYLLSLFRISERSSYHAKIVNFFGGMFSAVIVICRVLWRLVEFLKMVRSFAKFNCNPLVLVNKNIEKIQSTNFRVEYIKTFGIWGTLWIVNWIEIFWIVKPLQPTESIAENPKFLSLPNSEISAFPATQPNRVYKRNLYL